jgi:hypothetical protein
MKEYQFSGEQKGLQNLDLCLLAFWLKCSAALRSTDVGVC